MDCKNHAYRLVKKRNDNDCFMRADIISENDKRANIDRLPMYFLMAWDEELKSGDKTVSTGQPFFTFETKNWKKDLVKDEASKKLKQELDSLINAYNSINKFSSDFSRYREKLKNTNYAGCIRNILQIQYGDLEQNFGDSELSVDNVLEMAYEEISGAFSDSSKITSAVQKLKDCRWHLAGGFEENREDKYNVRRACLKDILCEREINSLPEEQMQPDNGGNMTDIVNDGKYQQYWNEFYSIYRNAVKNKTSRADWMKKIRERCRCHLKEISPDIKKEVPYIYAQNATGSFFWDVLRPDEICSFIVADQGENRIC